VTDDIPAGQAKPGLTVPENKNLILAGIVAAVVIIAVIAILFSQSSSDTGTKVLPPTPTPTAQKIEVSPSATPKLLTTIRQTPTQTIPPETQTTVPVPVDFALQSGTPSSCGVTCRQMDASVTNTGYALAHSVCIEVSMHNSRNDIINLNGETTLQRCIGDLPGGQSKTESITVNADCGAFATKCIGETLTLKTKITSVEKTVQFPDQLIAV
jgi:hypothetical protein